MGLSCGDRFRATPRPLRYKWHSPVVTGFAFASLGLLRRGQLGVSASCTTAVYEACCNFGIGMVRQVPRMLRSFCILGSRVLRTRPTTEQARVVALRPRHLSHGRKCLTIGTTVQHGSIVENDAVNKIKHKILDN